MLYWLSFSWRKRLFQSCMSGHSRSNRSPLRRSVVPIVELLEGRVLPSVALNLMEFHDPSRIPAGLKPSALGILPQDNGFDFPVGYTPDQLRTAYGIDNVMFGSVVGDGTGQTIAIVDAYDDPAFVNSTTSNFANSDLAQFDSQLGIPDPPSFTKVNENGQTSPLPKTDPAGAGNPNGNWEIEEALDVEWAHGMAPGANIVLVEANSDSNSDLFTAVATAAALPGVSAVSMSWGIDEYSGENSQDSTFVTPTGHQGVTFLAASGDNGGFTYDAQGNPTTIPGILYPAASSNVVAVGGTTLQLNDDDTYNSETAWSGSGGGTSLYEKEPAFQENSQQTGFRTTPDVAFDADPNTGVAVYDSYNDTDNSGPWVEVGGTSLGAPSWAGLIAIANQGRVLVGASTLDGPSQTLPALYAISTTDFNDITSGNNGVFSAGTGYDEVTGLGSPNAPSLMASLSTYGTANHIAVTSQPPGSVIVGDSFGVVVAAEDPQGGVDPGFSGTLTISLGSNPSGATLGGTLTATASDGVAVFDGLTLNELGNGYTLQITGSTFPSIATNSFDVISNPTPWQGTFYPVPTDTSLRAAINEADSNGYAFNTILLSTSTYLLSDTSSGGLVIDNASSLPSKTLTIAGQGQNSSIIGSVFNWHDRIFEIEGSAGLLLNVIMQNLTIQGGDAQNGGVLGGNDALGGGLLIDDANVTLTNDVVQNNQAQGALGAAGKAGAIGAMGGAGGDGNNANGGGIYLASGTLSLFNDTVSGNAARGGVGGAGGAGGGQGTKSAAGVTAGQGGAGGQGGSAAGGGIYAAGGTVLLDNDNFSSNQAVGGPGGTGGTGGSGGHGKNSSLESGKPGGVGGTGGAGGTANGGAIYLAGGSITLTGTALQNNTARGGAGGQGGHGGPGTAVGVSLTSIFGGSGSTLNLGGLGGSGAGGAGGNGGRGGAGGAASGGGVYVAGGSLTLVNATLSGNQAIGGPGGAGGTGGTGGFGAATNSLGLPVGKTAGNGGSGGQAGPGNGGGIFLAGGKVILYASTLNANLAQGGKGGAGGVGGDGPIAALGSGSSLGFGSSSLGFGSGGGSSGFGSSSGFGGGGNAVNSAGAGGNGGNGRTGEGGGIYVSGGAFTLIDDTVAGNIAEAGASGSAGQGGKAGTGKLTGGSGAAGNPGDSYGGGLYVNGGTVKLENSTVALNTQEGTGSGGGAVVQSSGTVTAVSTLFGDNGSVDFSGNITATDSLFQTAPINGTLSGSGNLVGVNPLLEANGLQNNGGPTETIALQALSPAIGKGANPENLFADQRGYDTRSGSGGTDIGAYQTNAQADTQAPTATLQAGSVTAGNASALNPYTFTITYSDNVAVAVSTLSNAVVEVLPPGSGVPISANVEGIVAVGATDGIGNAVSFVVTYQITPPGGSWTSTDNGNYTVTLGGGTVTDLAGNPVASGSLGTFSVNLGQTLTAAITGPSDGYSGVAGQTRTYTVSATDPLPTQQSEGFTYNIAWGDGLTDTIGPSAASPDTVSHVYSKPGTYTITLTATDRAGTTSPAVTSTATILGYEVQGSTLAIGGTTGNDSFVIAAGANAGSLTAKVNNTSIGTFQVAAAAIYGDGGTDKVTISGEQNSANTFTLNGSTATFTAASLSPNLITVALNNIATIAFAGGKKGNSFTNTAATVASVMQGLAGGTNTYTFAGTTMGAAATIQGSGTSNTLYGPNLASVWNITGTNVGNLNGISWSFTGIQNLVGGSKTNDFIFSNKATIAGSLNGGGGGTLDESHYTTAVSVNLQTNSATAIKGTFSNLVAIIGGSAINTLIGANIASTWNINGTNTGTVNGSLAFTAFANLTGGTVNNDFVFASGAGVTGKITGKTTATNRLDYTAYTTGIYVNLLSLVATGTGGISNIQQVYGGSGNDIIVGAGSGILLQAGSGSNLIIGGTGRATIDSGSGEDLVIAGSTSYDSNATALKAIEAYWSDTAIAFSTRVTQLSGVGTPTGHYKLTSSTVKHAAASDTIVLGSADDWLFWRKTGTDADHLTGTPEKSTII